MEYTETNAAAVCEENSTWGGRRRNRRPPIRFKIENNTNFFIKTNVIHFKCIYGAFIHMIKRLGYRYQVTAGYTSSNFHDSCTWCRFEARATTTGDMDDVKWIFSVDLLANVLRDLMGLFNTAQSSSVYRLALTEDDAIEPGASLLRDGIVDLAPDVFSLDPVFALGDFRNTSVAPRSSTYIGLESILS